MLNLQFCPDFLNTSDNLKMEVIRKRAFFHHYHTFSATILCLMQNEPYSLFSRLEKEYTAIKNREMEEQIEIKVRPLLSVSCNTVIKIKGWCNV